MPISRSAFSDPFLNGHAFLCCGAGTIASTKFGQTLLLIPHPFCNFPTPLLPASGALLVSTKRLGYVDIPYYGEPYVI